MQDQESDSNLITIPLEIPEDLIKAIETAMFKIKLGFAGYDDFIIFATRKYLEESLGLKELME